jgi:hypothetical protein
MDLVMMCSVGERDVEKEVKEMLSDSGWKKVRLEMNKKR